MLVGVFVVVSVGVGVFDPVGVGDKLLVLDGV